MFPPILRERGANRAPRRSSIAQRLGVAACVSFAILPIGAGAQTEPAEDFGLEWRLDRDGARDHVRDYGREEDPRAILRELAPLILDFLDAIDEPGAYHFPEVLPNGDILIRRRAPLPGDRDAPERIPRFGPDREPEEERPAPELFDGDDVIEL